MYGGLRNAALLSRLPDVPLGTGGGLTRQRRLAEPYLLKLTTVWWL
jgi:hypothetical protein